MSTVSIFISHLQTIGIIGNLMLEWPDSVVWVTAALSGNVLELNFVRPECLLLPSVCRYFPMSSLL